MNDNVIKELELFKKISSDRDYNIVIGDDLTFQEYRRMEYILVALKMDYLLLYFCNKNYSKFKEKIKYLERNDYESEIYIDIDMYEKWLEEFTLNIEDEELKREVMKIVCVK